MPLVFNSITQFIEQIGRRRSHKANPSQLDGLDCIFTGPSALATDFVPRDLAIHPEFPGMQCASWDIVTKEALNAEVRVQYTGKLTAGSGPYTSPPVITQSRHSGEVSYSTSWSTSDTQVATAGYTVRYTARSVTFKYLTNRKPAGDYNGIFATEAAPYLGTENLHQFQTSLAYATGAPHFDTGLGYGGYVVSTLVWSNDLTDVSVNDLGNGWWDVAETYLTQPHVNSSVA